MVTVAGVESVVPNVLSRYADHLAVAAKELAATRSATGAEPPPVSFDLPEPGAALSDYFAAGEIALQPLGTASGRRLFLMDLMRDPGTRTVKSFASLTIVARAVGHVQRTGERVVIVTPTSGNKGTALRSAVAGAVAHGLVTADQLRIVTLVPRTSAGKLRTSALSQDPALRPLNPVLVADTEEAAVVKALAADAAAHAARTTPATARTRVWHTLDLDNYRMADSVRAFVEAELMPIRSGDTPRVHAHAVSSAFGLLGYHVGHGLLARGYDPHLPPPARHPLFFLVQHLATPDMVVSATGAPPPSYRHGADGVWRQVGDARFPAETDDPAESLDPTFYTKAPVTSPQTDEIIAAHGGGGVVVSRRECLRRYDEVGAVLAGLGHRLPEDPAEIREWSLVKVVTGVLVAAERDLLPREADVVVHGSGFYTDEILPPMDPSHLRPVASAADVTTALDDVVRH